MILFRGSYILGYVDEGKAKGNYRASCSRCSQKVTSSSIEAADDYMNRHICDPGKNTNISWLVGKED